MYDDQDPTSQLTDTSSLPSFWNLPQICAFGTQRMHLYVDHRPSRENLVCNALGPFNYHSCGKHMLKISQKDQPSLSNQHVHMLHLNSFRCETQRISSSGSSCPTGRCQALFWHQEVNARIFLSLASRYMRSL